MKKFLVTGALAIALAITSQQQASAWVNFKTGIGANLCWQSGGNCILGGLYRNGQPPAPGGIEAPCSLPFGCNGPGFGGGCGGGGAGYPAYGPGYAPGYAPGAVPPGPLAPVPGYLQAPPMDHGAGGYPAVPPGAIPGRVQSYPGNGYNAYSAPRR